MGSMMLVALTAIELTISAAVTYDSDIPLGRAEAYLMSKVAEVSAGHLHSAVPRGRFFGYYRQGLLESNGKRLSYNGYRRIGYTPIARELLLTTQATLHRLEDIQGYNPLHLRLYDKLLQVANRQRQNYRSAYIMRAALDSPLLDMLNVRYVLTAPDTRLGPKYRKVADVRQVWLHENRRALPRAWIVHQTTVGDDDTALRQIDSGKVDLREVAVVPRQLAGIGPASGPEWVSVTEYSHDEISLQVQLSSPGLVILSELDYPAWKVEIDGHPQPVVRANGALRAVEVPAGKSTVVWQYRSTPARLGMVLSLVGVAGTVLILLYWPQRARPVGILRSALGQGRATRNRGRGPAIDDAARVQTTRVHES
jgi:hypothetical protein